MDQLEKKAAAEVLGHIAFKNDAPAIPALDNELCNLLVGVKVGDGAPILRSWLRGWDNANLAAPVIFND